MRRVVVTVIARVERLSTKRQFGKQILPDIDYDLQQVRAIFGSAPSAAVALDPRTAKSCDVITRTGSNDFAVRISANDWKSLNEDRQKPLLNRAIQVTSPGSVFKIVPTAMLEDKNPRKASRRLPRLNGPLWRLQVLVYGKASRCGGLAASDPSSCDIFFYNGGMRLGIVAFPTTH